MDDKHGPSGSSREYLIDEAISSYDVFCSSIADPYPQRGTVAVIAVMR